MTSKLSRNEKPAGPAANVYSSLQFASVNESRENLFASSLQQTPTPPAFKFQERNGRLNWRHIMNADVDKISEQCDLR